VNLDKVDLNKLRTFQLVAEHQGITPAAERLSLTRSAVSQTITALERSLQVALFHRVGRRLTLTPEGRQLHGRLREHHAQLERILGEVVSEERAVRGVLRVGLFLGFSRLRLARVLERFTARHPDAEVRLLYASQRDLGRRLLAGRVDVVLSLSPIRAAGAPLRCMRLLRQQLVLVGGRRFFRRPFDLGALGQVPVIDYYQADPLVHHWLRHHFGLRSATRAAPTVRIWAATTDLVLELVLDGAGVAVLPRDLVGPFLRARRLFVVSTGKPELTDFLWLNELAASYPRPLLEAFRAVVAEAFPAGVTAEEATGVRGSVPSRE
jgi:DNA-binding transcriptional LysR family regulator